VIVKQVYIVLLIVVAGCLNMTGQTAQQLIMLGDEALKTSNYHSAVQYYEAALSMESNNDELTFHLAEAYRHLYNYTSAASAYLSVWQNAKERFPQSGFHAAMMLKSQEKYPEAIEMFQKYIEFKPVQDVLISKERALFEIEACDSSIIILARSSDMKIQNFNEVNTPWSEFNPVPVGDSIFLFSALRPLVETENPLLATGDYRAQIYFADYGSVGLNSPRVLSLNINGKDSHTANITVSPDGNRAYFNRCEYTNYRLRCDVWVSELKNNQWSKARKLPSPLNDDKYTTTQPNVVTDPVSGNDMLYFSSDRQGGMGGLDLWFCVIANDKPQAPVNLGSIINTPGDEITPFYNIPENTLFFSSDMHYGLGGFDVFFSKGSMSSWAKPQNAGSPINTGANDFYFTTGSDEAFLTSNRAGSLTFREQTCCNDIYIVQDFRIQDTLIVETPDSIPVSIKEDILELLPLSLYFDNDHPDPKTLSSNTKLTYKQTWVGYMKEKKRFIEEYSKGLDGFAMYYAMTEMEDFFDNYVESGYAKLEILSEFLYQDLKSGSDVTLKVRGFTSPLTSAEYNIMLAGRRISSLVNYFRTWNNSVLSPFMDFSAENGASLRIIEEPSGEALSAVYVSDNPLDRQQSVYSKSASLERRIQILIYESDFRKYVNIDENNPVIHIPDNLIHLTAYTDITDAEVDVSVSNPGKVRLTISDVHTSSPSLVIISRPDYIEAGEQSVIRVRISGKPKAPFTEHIIIHSDSSEERSVVFFTTAVKEK